MRPARVVAPGKQAPQVRYSSHGLLKGQGYSSPTLKLPQAVWSLQPAAMRSPLPERGEALPCPCPEQPTPRVISEHKASAHGGSEHPWVLIKCHSHPRKETAGAKDDGRSPDTLRKDARLSGQKCLELYGWGADGW